MIKGFIDSLFRRKPKPNPEVGAEPEAKAEARRDVRAPTERFEQHPYNFQNALTDGFQLCVTMNATVPLAILERHGEVANAIPATDQNLSGAHAVWIPRCIDPYRTQFESSYMASSIGYLPDDGGDFLPYLKAVRRIIERPIPSRRSDVSEAVSRLQQIRALPGGHTFEADRDTLVISKSLDVVDYFPMAFGNEDRALECLLRELSEFPHTGLSVKHIRELHAKGYESLQAMLEAPDEVLLSLAGIGKKKLEKVRQNLAERQPRTPRQEVANRLQT